MPSVVQAHTDGFVGRLTLDRPERKNAIDLETAQALRRGLAAHRSDATVRVVVLAGQGGDFSSGGDIADMVARRNRGVETYERLRSDLGALVHDILSFPKPVIARVDGVCLGAGAGVALACDALLATRSSRIGFPFVKIGLVPDTATTWLVPHVVGLQHARRLLLTGQTISADEANDLGLVTDLADDAAQLDDTLRALTQSFADLPAGAVRDAKRLLWSTVALTVNDAIHHEAIAQGLRFHEPDHAAAVDAFLTRGRRE